MIAPTDKLNAIKACKTDIAMAIEEKGVPIENASFREYAELIGQINGTGSDIKEDWTAPSDWPDIKTILENDTLPEGYVSSYIQLLADDSVSFPVSPGVAYRFSDAPDVIVQNSSTAHVWDASKDFPCSFGYKTRWVISYFTSKSVSVAVDYKVRYCVFGCIYTADFYERTVLVSLACLDGYYLKPPANSRNLFREAFSLREIPVKMDLSGSKRTSYMFYRCHSLRKLPRRLDLSACTSTQYMFQECTSLTEIPALDLSKCSEVGGMFASCSSLVRLPPRLDLSNCQNADRMFFNCVSLVKAPTLLGMSSCTNVNNMFYCCNSLKTVPPLPALPACTNANSLFAYCYSLVTSPAMFDLPSCTNASDMFSGCSSLIQGPVTLNLPNCTNASSLFRGCYNLRSASIAQLKTAMTLGDSILLSRESLLSILNSLQTVTAGTLTLGSSLLGKLTAENKAIATSKGWTLA